MLGNNLQVGPKDMVIAPRDTNAKSKDLKKKLEVKRSQSFRVESAKINRASENVKLSCHRRHSHRGYYKNSRGFESHNTVTLMNRNFLWASLNWCLSIDLWFFWHFLLYTQLSGYIMIYFSILLISLAKSPMNQLF